MKYLIMFFSVLFMLNNAVFAIQSTINPEMLTISDSINYETINSLSTQLFKNIETSINTDLYPYKYDNFPLLEKKWYQSTEYYYYVSCEDVELIFNKKTKDLEYISFPQKGYPKCFIIYEYPSGNLKMVKIGFSKNEIYIFNSNGKFVDFKTYVDDVNQKIKSNWIVPKNVKNTGLIVLLTINRKGQLENYKIVQPSGSKDFDDSGIRAILQSVPFKPIPESYPIKTICINFIFIVENARYKFPYKNNR